MALYLYIDGVSRGNPGPTGIGIVLQSPDEQILQQGGRFLGDLTDMEAAAQGLLAGLEAAAATEPDEIAVFCSSQWLVRQLTGQGRPPGDHLAMLLAQAQMLLLRFDTWQITHLPPDQNSLAAALAIHAAKSGRDVETARTDEGGTPRGASDRIVLVRVVEGANTRSCPEPCGPNEVFEFGEVTPAHMCLDALAAVLDAVMACKRQGDSIVENLPVRRSCARPDCGAVFEIDLG